MHQSPTAVYVTSLANSLTVSLAKLKQECPILFKDEIQSYLSSALKLAARRTNALSFAARSFDLIATIPEEHLSLVDDLSRDLESVVYRAFHNALPNVEIEVVDLVVTINLWVYVLWIPQQSINI